MAGSADTAISNEGRPVSKSAEPPPPFGPKPNERASLDFL